MKTLDILVQARELISEPKNWTQNAGARNADGQRVRMDDPNACSFCTTAAVQRVLCSVDPAEYGYRRAMRALCEAMDLAPYSDEHSEAWSFGISVVGWNDNVTHSEVIAGFDLAIENERKKSGKQQTTYTEAG